MTAATNANPAIPSDQQSGYDPAGHQYNVLQRMTNVATDATTGEVYGDKAVDTILSASTSTLFTTTQTTVGTSDSGDLDTSKVKEISIDITTSAQAGTNPTIQFFYKRKGADGIYYSLWQSAVLSAAANTISTSIGPGLAYNQSLGPTGKLTWTVGGTNTPTWTFTPNVYGK